MSMLKDKMQINNKVCPKVIRSGMEIDLIGKIIETKTMKEWKDEKETRDDQIKETSSKSKAT